MNATAKNDDATHTSPAVRRPEKTVIIAVTMPVAGRNRMYTSGWPQNQNRCWYSRTLPPSDGTKKAVWKSRSASSSDDDRVTAGNANTIMNAMPRIAHTNVGMRLSDIPGARILNVVTMKFTAPAVDDTPTKITPSPQKSRLSPGENRTSDSGV